MKTENNFAKLFESQDHQVLFQKRADDTDKETPFKIQNKTVHNGSEVAIEYSYKTEEERDSNFENIEQSTADDFMKNMLPFLN